MSRVDSHVCQVDSLQGLDHDEEMEESRSALRSHR